MTHAKSATGCAEYLIDHGRDFMQLASINSDSPKAAPAVTRAASFVEALAQQPIGVWIDNLQTELQHIELVGLSFPVTINRAADGPTCYICCPTKAYLDYAQDELRHFESHPALKALLSALLGSVRPLLRASGLDQQVQVNNYLLATNPVPRLHADDIAALTHKLVDQWPEHSIVWRSLNTVSDVSSIEAFRLAGYRLLPARQIYLFDCRQIQPRISRDERRDAALLRGGGYRQDSGPFSGQDFSRMQALYQRLYLDKYTWLNPQYTAEFLGALQASGHLSMQALRNRTGQLDGVIGFFEQDGVMTAPVVGYDTSLPADTGLYRQLMAIAFARARRQTCLFNMSAGAASFKRNRGGLVALEYTAVYDRHRNWPQRAATWIVRELLVRIGVPVLKRFEL